MTLAAIQAWLTEIDEPTIEDWANKGLLRRGHKLAAGAAPDTIRVEGETLCGVLDGHRQVLQGAGFGTLDCGCPATGVCHHQVAFLLVAKAWAAALPGGDAPLGSAGAAPESDAAAAEIPDWVRVPEAALTRLLGRAPLARARRWMRLGVDIALAETPAGWVGEMTLDEHHRVRIPRSGGPAATGCTCGASRCLHGALAVLELRRRRGLSEPDRPEGSLDAGQAEVLGAIREWMLALAATGLGRLASAPIDQARALATAARQEDLPRVAGLLGGLADLLDEEHLGKSHADTRGLGSRLAGLRLLVSVLERGAPGLPWLSLAGVHRTLYAKTTGLGLIGVAPERWQGRDGLEGLSLHLFAPAEARWYRLTESRRIEPGQRGPQRDPWTPQAVWKSGRWADGPLLRDLCPAAVELTTGWVSADGRLSGRPGTRVQWRALTDPAEGLAVAEDFADVHRRYAEAMRGDLLAPPPRLPVVVRIAAAAAPDFDPHTQWWSRRLMDQAGRGLCLGILIRDPIAAAKRRRIDLVWGPGAPRLVFGMLHRARAGLALDPIALLHPGDDRWQPLTLD